MTRRKNLLVLLIGAVLIAAPIGVLALRTDPAPEKETQPNLKAAEILTWNCEFPEHKPETILLTCADGGWMVHKITWSTWGVQGAEGTGIFRENLCEPSCAEGEIAEEKVKVRLSNLTELKGRFYLRTLDISPTSGKDFPWDRANGLEWDVMEFGTKND